MGRKQNVRYEGNTSLSWSHHPPVSGKPKHFLIETEADSNDDAPLKLSGFEENPNNERPASGSQETPGSDYCSVSHCCPDNYNSQSMSIQTCCTRCTRQDIAFHPCPCGLGWG